MAKKVGGFAQKSAKAREKRDYSLVKYIKSVISEKTGAWRFQEQILQVKDGEDIKAALKKADIAAHPAPEQIPVIQPDEPKPEAVEEVAAEDKAEASSEPVMAEEAAEEKPAPEAEPAKTE